MKHLILLGALCMVVFFATSPSPTHSAGVSAARTRPNIVLILADDLGRETLGCYEGTSYKTPHIDQLGQTGARFSHCYSMPTCHPTLVTLMTGQYSARLRRPAWGTFPKSKDTETFAHVLRKAGYTTAVAGKWQLTQLKKNLAHPHQLGFDEYCLFGWHEGPRYYRPLIWQNGEIRNDVKDRYGPDVYCQFLIDFITRNKDRPFLAYYSMALCHDVTDDLAKPVPYGPGKDRYDTFHEMVEAMDQQVGRLVAALDRLGLRENTLILFTADNGSPKRSIIRAKNGRYQHDPVVSKMGARSVPGGKGGLTDTGTRVPLIANWQGMIPAGTTRNDLIDMSDFLPTLAELARARLPRDIIFDGRSFAAQLHGAREQHRNWVYSENYWVGRPGGKGRYWVRAQRWKLYDDGRLFDMDSDVQERNPLLPPEDTAESAAARKQLQAAIDKLPAG